ncbi:MAG: hypothetical protein IJ410_04615 [Oscillospiraceae bacterium]|nr:hypothetical protein [Oscillospiraceae bacterium]
MRKIISLITAAVFLLVFTACGEEKSDAPVAKVELDTGFPGIVMLVDEADNEVMKRELSHIYYYNTSGQEVRFVRQNSSEQIEMEKYYTYHDDGRLYQELCRWYDGDTIYQAVLYQYEYTFDSNIATATIWQKYGDVTGSDSVQHTMEYDDSEIQIYGILDDHNENYVTVKIRGISEWRNGGKVAETEYLAGKAIDSPLVD